MPSKTINNQTGAVLFIQLFLRGGDDPANLAATQAVWLAAQESQNVPFGDAASPYLNGIAAMTLSSDSGPAASVFQYVLERSSATDNLYNQNNTITITASGQTLAVAGSNS